MKTSQRPGEGEREKCLAWISLGLLDLARAVHTQTGDCDAQPLFEKHERVAKASQRYLLQAEAYFQRALKTTPEKPDCQLLALACFGLGSVYAIARGVFSHHTMISGVN